MISIALILVILIATAKAAPAAYCAMYNDGTRSCGIPSQQMCMQSVSGVGGYCQEDFTDRIPPNLIQRMRGAEPAPSYMPPRSAASSVQRTRSRGSVAPVRPVTTSPCMSLSGDTCTNNLY